MDNKQILKQTIQFNKTAFDNGFTAMMMAQDQCEKMVTTFLDQAAWLPEEGKKVISDWVKAYKKGCKDFKTAMDENYTKVEEFVKGT